MFFLLIMDPAQLSPVLTRSPPREPEFGSKPESVELESMVGMIDIPQTYYSQ
jgi:hypothetical protein